ncbi:MAG: hypothetical protein ACRC1I_22190 [Pseudomonas proteolytica]|uniref:hypothetical protein n=1 Tax=Pseudomonas proteolytica TaxID=219574 RepID=UPI003F356716
MESSTLSNRGGWPAPTEIYTAPVQWIPQSPPARPAAQQAFKGPSFDSKPRAINFAQGNDYRRSFPPPASATRIADDATPSSWKQYAATEGLGSRSSRPSFSATPTASSARSAPTNDDSTPNSSTGTKPKDIWGGFSQGSNGDCVAISAIKAAMVRFGQKPTDVFKDVKEAGDGFDITMKDGVKVHLSQEELKMAEKSSGLKGNDPEMMKDAAFMYAASAKRAQMENNDGTASQSFAQALKTIEDGEGGAEGLLRLGLKDHMKQGSVSDLLNGAVGIVNRVIDLGNGLTGGHSMAVINGIEEQWGKKAGYVAGGNIFILT